MSKTIYDGSAVDAYKSTNFMEFLEKTFKDVELMNEESAPRSFKQAIMLPNEGVSLFYDIFSPRPYLRDGWEVKVNVTAFGAEEKISKVEQIILAEAAKYASK